MHPDPNRYLVSFLGLALVASLAGCGTQEPLSPAESVLGAHQQATSARPVLAEADGPPLQASGGFFPLELGNRWQYARTFRLQTVEPGEPPGDPYEYHARISGEMICRETLDGREYTVEQLVERSPGSADFHTWVWFREDATGLYEADLVSAPTCAPAGTSPPGGSVVTAFAGFDQALARALSSIAETRRPAFLAAGDRLRQRLALLHAMLGAGGRGAGSLGVPAGSQQAELTRLEYPLHPGASWNIREDPLYVATVEGVEALDLPAGRLVGARARYFADFFGPQDRVHLWHGRSGFLKLAAHLEFEGTDPDGNPIRLIAEEEQVLVDLTLDGGHLAAR